MYGMRRDELRLLPNDPAWKDDFITEKERILNSLAGESVRIEHVGSTAIETIHAKPILDIAILCDEAGLALLIASLPGLGYEYREQYENERDHYYAVLDNGPVRLCQMHIFTKATPDWESKLAFRDVLREDVELAREYSEYKLSLAGSIADKKEYAEIKSKWLDTFIVKVMKRAGSQRLGQQDFK